MTFATAETSAESSLCFSGGSDVFLRLFKETALETPPCLQHRTRETALSAGQVWGGAPQGPRVSVEGTRAALRPPAPRKPFLDKVWARRTEVKSVPGTTPTPFTTTLCLTQSWEPTALTAQEVPTPASAYDSFLCLVPPALSCLWGACDNQAVSLVCFLDVFCNRA